MLWGMGFVAVRGPGGDLTDRAVGFQTDGTDDSGCASMTPVDRSSVFRVVPAGVRTWGGDTMPQAESARRT